MVWCLEADEENRGDLDRVGALISDLIMWKDVSKSTLWFVFGCLCFLSSCFTKGVNFRSAVSFFVLLLLLCVCLVVESETPVLVISVFSRPYLDWQFSCWVFRSSQTQFVKGNMCLVCHDVVSLLSYTSFGFGCTKRICISQCVQKPGWEKKFCQAERRWHFASCKIDSSCTKFCNFKD